MSNNYDNWNRLVKVVLRREHDRQLALADSESEESSLKYSISSFSFRSEPNPDDQNPQLELAVLDDIINRLLEYPLHSRTNRKVNLLENEIRYLCNTSREIFLSQPSLLGIEAPVKICGNIHGQFPDLLSLFETGGYPPEAKYLFLGGYADYGKQSIETICLLLAFKIKYPENFLFLRGNHECLSLSGIYEFYDECKHRLNITLWKVFVDCFNCLPAAALINDKILCMHGGLSPELDNLDQIRNLPRPTAVPNNGLLWSNPHSNLKGLGMNDRGISHTFGKNKVSEFLMKHDLDFLCRAHQVVEDGYEFFDDRKLVTLFSVPKFAGQFGNAGAIMCVDESLVCTFEIFKPALRKAWASVK